MTIYRYYVRGHGWEEKSPNLPASEDLAIDLITVGMMGCTMSGHVADTVISQAWDSEKIKQEVTAERLIYWTHDDRENWFKRRIRPRLEKPKVAINPYATLNTNLCLGGDDKLNDLVEFPTLKKCGLCYFLPATSTLQWVFTLEHREVKSLAEILEILRNSLQGPEDVIQLYWTACMDAEFWSGNRRAVGFRPEGLV